MGGSKRITAVLERDVLPVKGGVEGLALPAVNMLKFNTDLDQGTSVMLCNICVESGGGNGGGGGCTHYYND